MTSIFGRKSFRMFGGKKYFFHGRYHAKHVVENAQDRLKYEAFKDNKLVSFRVIKENEGWYALYYRFHAEARKGRR